jgi:hypothetical protein
VRFAAVQRRLRPAGIALAVGCLLPGCFAREPKRTDRSIEAPPAAPPAGSAAPDAAGDRRAPAPVQSESADAPDDGATTPAPRRQAAPEPAPAAPKSGSPRQKSSPRRAAPSAAGRSDALQDEDEEAREIEAS